MEGPIDLKHWRDTPAVLGRPGTEADVEAGCAVFAVGGDPVDLDLPTCAIVREEGIGEETPVIIIQAELIEDGTVAIGFRLLTGGNGIAPLADVELLTDPDERFR